MGSFFDVATLNLPLCPLCRRKIHAVCSRKILDKGKISFLLPNEEFDEHNKIGIEWFENGKSIKGKRVIMVDHSCQTDELEKEEKI